MNHYYFIQTNKRSDWLGSNELTRIGQVVNEIESSENRLDEEVIRIEKFPAGETAGMNEAVRQFPFQAIPGIPQY